MGKTRKKHLSIFLLFIMFFSLKSTVYIKADEISDTKSKIKTMSDDIIKANDSIGKLSQEIDEVSLGIENKKTEIDGLNDKLNKIHDDKKNMETVLKEKNVVLDGRLRDSYMNGYLQEIELIFTSKSISELLMRSRVIGAVLKEDRATLNEIEKAKSTLTTLEKNLGETIAKLEEENKQLETQRKTLNDKLNAQTSNLEALKSNKNSLRDILKNKEMGLLSEAKKILENKSSSEEDLLYARNILDAASGRISTDEAVIEAKSLYNKANLLNEQIAEKKKELEKIKQEAEKQAALDEIKRLEEEQAKAKADAERAKNEAPVTPSPSVEPTPAPSKEETPSGSTQYLTFSYTYYTDLPEENGGYSGTASGSPFAQGVIANNVLPFGTKIYLEGMGEYTVLDRGGYEFYTKTRIDIFVPRKPGESNSEYKSRVLRLGRGSVRGYIK